MLARLGFGECMFRIPCLECCSSDPALAVSVLPSSVCSAVMSLCLLQRSVTSSSPHSLLLLCPGYHLMIPCSIQLENQILSCYAESMLRARTWLGSRAVPRALSRLVEEAPTDWQLLKG